MGFVAWESCRDVCDSNDSFALVIGNGDLSIVVVSEDTDGDDDGGRNESVVG